MRWAMLLLLALTGCASPSMALYQHPETKDRQMCARAKPDTALSGVDLIDLLIIIPANIGDNVVAGNQYADCKTRLEQQGYVREP